MSGLRRRAGQWAIQFTLLVLAFITFVPDFVLFLPRMLGYQG